MMRTAVLVALAIVVAGCSSVADNAMTIFVDPAKYQYSTCEGLGRQRETSTKKEQELRQLMDRAEQSAGGTVVNVLAYKGDHVAALEELQLIDRAARAKNCDGTRNWPSNSAIQ
jgi:hypothetical protein